MSLVYRLLGVIARMSERMSHTRLNGIPANWFVIIIAGIFFAIGATQVRDAVVNGNKPRSTNVKELLDHRDMGRNYVTVNGVLYPKLVGSFSKNGGEAKDVWGALIDPNDNRALMVEREGNVVDEDPKPATVTGMVVDMKGEIHKWLNEQGGSIEGVPVDTNYVLKEGKRPGSLAVGVTMVTAFGLIGLLFLLVFLKKYVIFQRSGKQTPNVASIPVSASAGEGVDLRATGKFSLDEKNSQRFLDVNAGLAHLESGDVALFSNIDASEKFMGAVTRERKGMWAIVMKRDSLRDPEKGTLYVGTAARPALRIRYTDEITGKPSEAILSCATEAERESLIGEINKASGYELVRA